MEIYASAGAMVIMGLAEWLHTRRVWRVGRLAFGPGSRPCAWTRVVPWCRVGCVGAMVWGFLTLIQVGPRPVRGEQPVPEGGFRHLVMALDVSPSMRLQDAGPDGSLTRAQRASEVLLSLLRRIATEQVRISIVAFYTGAKPVVVDTFDLEVVNNCLNDLPLDIAFEVGKTDMLGGLREAVALAQGWAPQSTTLVLVSDGDTIPDSGMPKLPRAVRRVVVAGVGDARVGRFIDGHQSRQDAFTLRQLARRLQGDYFDANRNHLPSDLLASLAGALPMRDEREGGRRGLALVCIGGGGFTLAAIPLALAVAGSRWRSGPGYRERSVGTRTGDERAEPESESMTYA